MKRSVWFFVAIILLIGNQVNGQKSGLLKKVANSMANELLGKPQTSNAPQPEPDCACDPSELVIDLGGKLQLNYTELDISVRDDGAILLKDKI